jgi:hypothetical protein
VWATERSKFSSTFSFVKEVVLSMWHAPARPFLPLGIVMIYSGQT